MNNTKTVQVINFFQCVHFFNTIKRKRTISSLCVDDRGKKNHEQIFFYSSFKFTFYLSHWIERAKKTHIYTTNSEWVKLKKKTHREKMKCGKKRRVLIPFFRFGFLFILMMCVVGFSFSFLSLLSASYSFIHLVWSLHLIAHHSSSVFAEVFPFGGW